MAIVQHRRYPVKPTRNTPKPPAPFAEGLDAACSCNESYRCLNCLNEEHARLKSMVDLDRRFGPGLDELQWHAEHSPANESGYDVIGDDESDLRLIAAWSRICTEPDEEPTPGEYGLF